MESTNEKSLNSKSLGSNSLHPSKTTYVVKQTKRVASKALTPTGAGLGDAPSQLWSSAISSSFVSLCMCAAWYTRECTWRVKK